MKYYVSLSPTFSYKSLDNKDVVKFQKDEALAILLAKQIVFTNDHWWEKEFNDRQKDLFSINLNVNDCFCHGADAEEVLYSELQSLYEHYEIDPLYGPLFWCAKKRKTRPFKNICVNMTAWNLEEIEDGQAI
jgi:hypothetical protein